jgi:uncharacterized membrane protein YgcG
MKPSILFSTIALAVVLFSSCTSAYRAGQTPDDVYYSPTKEAPDEYVQAQDRRDSRMYEGSDQYYEDRYLRMRVANRGTWSALDDYYFNSPYGYNSFYYSDPFMWNSPWNNYWRWNSFYNPYSNFGWYGGGYYGNWAGGGWGGYHPGVIVGGGNHQPRVVNSRPVAFNRNSYIPNNGNNARIRGNVLGNNYQNSNSNRLANSYRGTNANGYSNYSNTNSNRYSNGNSNNYNNNNSSRSNSNTYRPESSSSNSRSYTPSSSSSSSSSGSSSGSSGGGGGVSRPGRN